jgi:hypothetical protein
VGISTDKEVDIINTALHPLVKIITTTAALRPLVIIIIITIKEVFSLLVTTITVFLFTIITIITIIIAQFHTGIDDIMEDLMAVSLFIDLTSMDVSVVVYLSFSYLSRG